MVSNFKKKPFWGPTPPNPLWGDPLFFDKKKTQLDSIPGKGKGFGFFFPQILHRILFPRTSTAVVGGKQLKISPPAPFSPLQNPFFLKPLWTLGFGVWQKKPAGALLENFLKKTLDPKPPQTPFCGAGLN